MTDNIFICAFCKHISPTLNGFVKHIEKIHNIDYQIYFDTYIEPNDNHLCPVCLNKRKFFKGKYRKTCCNPECNYIQRKNTCIARYGVSNPSFIPEVVEKKKQTCLKHYGVEFPMQSNSILEKAKEQCIIKNNIILIKSTILLNLIKTKKILDYFDNKKFAK